MNRFSQQMPFSISTAIPYVNGAPHMGHALEFVETDAIARYHRFLGEDVYFLTGTDEHGSKIVETAAKEGLPVMELINKNVQKFFDMLTQYQITFNDFIRTSDQKRHWPSCFKLWKKMVEKGDIYKGEYKGLYCIGCEEYKLEKDLVDGKCPNHDKKPTEVIQENYFFRLSKYSKQIAEILKSEQLKIIPSFRANEIIAMCESGLEDVSFSRPKEQLSWGIPVPGDESQVMYVWCDALTNYISALDYETEGKKFEQYWPMNCHVIGKDILRFHAGIWIGMLLSAEVPLPKSELVHGWIHFEGGRMSKSKGNVVDPIELANHYGSEQVRYYLLSEIPVGQDGDFSYSLFESKINADLSNNLGNFVNRVTSMITRFFDNRIPSGKQLIPGAIDDLWDDYHAAFLAFDHQKAAGVMISLVNFGNKLIADQKPWELAKLESKKSELEQLMRKLLKIMLHLSFMLSPFCPEKAEKIAKIYGVKLSPENLVKLQDNTLLSEVTRIQPLSELLFERIEGEKSWAQKKRQKPLPTTPIPVTPEAEKLELPMKSFILTDLKPLGSAVTKRLKKEWLSWLDELKERPAPQKKELEGILQKAYELNKNLGIGAEEIPGNALVQNFLKGPVEKFPFINPIVALYNFIEAKYGLALGAHDTSKLIGNVILKICDGKEHYLPLGEAKPKKVPKGTYAYCDDDGKRIICWLEIKQGQETAVTEKTSDVLFLLQGYPGIPQEYVTKAAEELKKLVEHWMR